jgi:hypothetical protein
MKKKDKDHHGNGQYGHRPNMPHHLFPAAEVQPGTIRQKKCVVNPSPMARHGVIPESN